MTHRILWGIAALALIACAFRPVQSTNTTAWASSQNKILVSGHCESLSRYDGLYAIQHAITPTNLTIRNDAIRSKCDSNPALLRKAFVDLLSVRGPGIWWPESYSYWLYTREALTFAGVSPKVLSITDSAYASLKAPDGSIPLPETGDERTTPPKPLQTFSKAFTYPYLTLRWPSGEYFLLSLDTLPNRLNLHHHPDFGYFAWWKDGVWLQRVKPYTGFDPKELLHEQEDLAVPKGPWSSPLWRVTPFKNTFSMTDSSVILTYSAEGATATRLISFNRDSVVEVKDW